MQYNFEWDPYKANQNLRKHKVSFEHTAEVFLDPLAISIYDEEHSSDEDRWITIGKNHTNNVLVVIHTFHEENTDHLEPDLCKYFPDAESVNKALRCLLPLLSSKKAEQHLKKN